MGYYSNVLVATTKSGYEKIKSVLDANDKCDYLRKEMQEFGTSKDDKYVAFGWDGIKWMSYNFEDVSAAKRAFEECGEPVKVVSIGEDGMYDEEYYGEEDYDMPYVEAITVYDYSDEWNMKEGFRKMNIV